LYWHYKVMHASSPSQESKFTGLHAANTMRHARMHHTRHAGDGLPQNLEHEQAGRSRRACARK